MILEPVRLVDGRAEAPCSLTTTSLLRSSQSQHPTRHLSQTAPVSFLGRRRGTSPCSFSGFPLGGSQEPRRLRRPTDEEPLTYKPTRWNRGRRRRRRRRRRSWVQLAARGPTGWPAPVPVPAELAGPTVKRAPATGPRFCDRPSITRTREQEMLMRRTGLLGQDAYSIHTNVTVCGRIFRGCTRNMQQ